MNEDISPKGMKYEDCENLKRLARYEVRKLEHKLGYKITGDTLPKAAHPPKWIYWLTCGAWLVVIGYWVYRFFK